MTDFTGSAVGENWRSRLAKNKFDVGFFAIVAAMSFGLSRYNGRGPSEGRVIAAAWTAFPDLSTGFAIWLGNVSPFLNRNGLLRYVVVGVPAFFVAALIRNQIQQLLGI